MPIEDDNTPMSSPLIYVLLVGGVVYEVLWGNKKVLVGIAVIWFLFEVVEYNLVTLLSHIFITSMLVIFIWFRSAHAFNCTTTPRIPEMISKESTFTEVSSILHAEFNHFLSSFLYVACGNDPKLFFLVIVSLCILSVIGNYFSFLNLLFFDIGITIRAISYYFGAKRFVQGELYCSRGTLKEKKDI